METLKVVFIVVAVLLAFVGPPLWWYSRGRKPGERRTRRWEAIVFGIFLLSAVGRLTPAQKGDWGGAVIRLCMAEAAVWSIAIGAKGSKIA